MAAQRRAWKRDTEVSNCEECDAAFTFFNRRHHCRKCGGIFCNKCTSDRRVIPGLDGPQRVCGDCREQLASGGRAPTQSGSAVGAGGGGGGVGARGPPERRDS
eukprot:Hpha_TRINITY_DN13529_c0_g1::TRINITY_DN13529_c0_g1_i1::g.111549::m.111549